MSATASNPVPFCQQNNRLWVAVLAVSAVLVLVFAFVLAFEDGRFKGLMHHVGQDTAAATPAGPGAAPAMAAGPGAAPATATPVAFVRPYGATALGATPAPADAPTASAPLTEALQRVALRAGPDVARQLQNSFNQVADKIRPCVVNINAVRPSRQVMANRANDPRFIDPFDGVPDKVFGKLAYESVGSGVIVDPAGYIVTNDHLVSGAVSIVVTQFNSNQPLAATLVATDRASDLAVLQLRGPGPFPAAELANSDRVEVGDWVLAVGNPFGLGHTVTSGIISSRRSAIRIGGVEYRDLLQTDAPINQGSSGGPLVDLSARVVGINTAIYAPTGVFNGTGFAIPANRVGAFVARVTAGGARAGALVAAETQPALQQVATGALQPWLGVGVSDVSPALAAKLQMPQPTGVFVNSVEAGSPAAEGELRRGDVIVNLAGQPVQDGRALRAIVGALPPGLKVPVVVWRGGKVKTRNVRLKAQPARW